MTLAYVIAAVVSAVLFLAYGLLCLFSTSMEEEFRRFGLSRFRPLTGALEVLGGIGLLVGLGMPGVMLAASTGLVVLMALGIGARVRVRDSFLLTLPAAVLLVVNVFICMVAWGLVRAA